MLKSMSLMEIWEPSQTLIPGKYTESKQDEIVIDFDGNEVSYPRNEWYKISPGLCHEYP